MHVYKPPKKEPELKAPPGKRKPLKHAAKKPAAGKAAATKTTVTTSATTTAPKKPPTRKPIHRQPPAPPSNKKPQKYKSPNRDPDSDASQSEKPAFVKEDDHIKVLGYQKFTIGPTSITDIKNHTQKYALIKTFIESKMGDCETITDVGSSNGLVAFIAAFYKYTTIHALDHDAECIQLIADICKEINITSIAPAKYSFGDPHEPSDIVFALALIHWIFSCTALMGAFDPIMAYLKSITNKYLVIEWIDPTDPCIKYLKHIDYNKQCIKEPYNKLNFLKSLKNHFTKVTKSTVNYSKTRELYLCTV